MATTPQSKFTGGRAHDTRRPMLLALCLLVMWAALSVARGEETGPGIMLTEQNYQKPPATREVPPVSATTEPPTVPATAGPVTTPPAPAGADASTAGADPQAMFPHFKNSRYWL